MEVLAADCDFELRILFCPQHMLKFSIMAEFDWWVKYSYVQQKVVLQ